MNKREQRRQIEKILTENIVNTTVWQKKPYTAVKVKTSYRHSAEAVYIEYGFTKVCWPDEWDEKYGIKLAICKAIADISRQIVGNSETS